MFAAVEDAGLATVLRVRVIRVRTVAVAVVHIVKYQRLKRFTSRNQSSARLQAQKVMGPSFRYDESPGSLP
jgi:hypothetical protein